MGMIAEKVSKQGVFIGTKTMKGKTIVYLAAEGPEIHKIKVTGALLGSARFGEEVVVIGKNCEQRFAQFENFFHETESLTIQPVKPAEIAKAV
jgi:hypothetical protein